MKLTNSLFVVFEGIDGSGKTTIMEMLANQLLKQEIEIIALREPSNSSFGQKIRNLAETHDSIPPEYELSLFIEDRKWDVEHNIKPALQAGKVVLLDRYYLSTACYQAVRGFDMQKIIAVNQEFAPIPDITIIIDVEVNTAISRIKRHRQFQSRLFEKESFLHQVRANYLSFKDQPQICIVDGNRPLEIVYQDVQQIIFEKIRALLS
jgi:dTMP kinase